MTRLQTLLGSSLTFQEVGPGKTDCRGTRVRHLYDASHLPSHQGCCFAANHQAG